MSEKIQCAMPGCTNDAEPGFFDTGGHPVCDDIRVRCGAVRHVVAPQAERDEAIRLGRACAEEIRDNVHQSMSGREVQSCEMAAEAWFARFPKEEDLMRHGDDVDPDGPGGVGAPLAERERADKAEKERDEALGELAHSLAILSAIPGHERDRARRVLNVLALAREYVSCDINTGQPWSGEAQRIYEDICALEGPIREEQGARDDQNWEGALKAARDLSERRKRALEPLIDALGCEYPVVGCQHGEAGCWSTENCERMQREAKSAHDAEEPNG